MDQASSFQQTTIEYIVEHLDQHGFVILDQVYKADYIQNLIGECTTHLDQFRDAAIQNGVVANIRSDHILWIDEKFPFAQQHLHNLLDLAQQLNRIFYFGIQDVEAHFACYDSGEFYALHKDNPQGKNGRVISSVYYLHREWQENWGGELHLKDKHNQWHTIIPKANRLALFQSDLLHEVLAAKQQRLSITAWLRNDAVLF